MRGHDIRQMRERRPCDPAWRQFRPRRGTRGPSCELTQSGLAARARVTRAISSPKSAGMRRVGARGVEVVERRVARDPRRAIAAAKPASCAA